MDKPVTRMALAVLLSLALLFVLTLSITLAQGSDSERAPRDPTLSAGPDLLLYVSEGYRLGGLYVPTYEPGSYILYQITLFNTGEENATGVRLSYTPPTSASFSASFNDQATPHTNHDGLVWDIDLLPAHSSRSFYVEMQVHATATVGSNLVSTASVTCTQVAIPIQNVRVDEISSFNLTIVENTLLSSSPGWLGSAQAEPDSEIVYRVRVSNESVVTDAQNVVVTDSLAPDVVFIVASPAGVYSPTAHIVTWNVGTLGKGQTQPFLVTVRTPITSGLWLWNEVKAGTSTPEIKHLDNSWLTLYQTMDLLPNVSVQHDPWMGITGVPGGETRFRIEVANSDFDKQVPVENVVLTERLERGLQYISSQVEDWWGTVRPISTTVISAADVTTVTWDLGTIPNDPDAGRLNRLSIDLRVRIPGGASAGDVFTATATVTTTTQPESSISDNEDQDTITAEAPRADLSLNNKYGCYSPQPGGWCEYTLWVANVGNVPITDAILIDHLPVGLTALGGSAQDASSPVVSTVQARAGTPGTQVVTWTLAPLPPGNYASLQLYVRVSERLAAGHTLTNTASVTRTIIVSDAKPSDNRYVYSSTVVEPVDIVVGKHSWDDWLSQPDNAVTYQVSLENQFIAAAENAILTDTILLHASLISATAGKGINPIVDGNTAVWNFGDLVQNEQLWVSVAAQVDPNLEFGQTFANLAWAAASSAESDTSNNYSLSYGHVGMLPEVSRINLYPENVKGCRVPGGAVALPFVVFNHSAVTATDVIVTDTLPAGLTYLGATTYDVTTTATVSRQHLVWNVGDIAPYSRVGFVVTAAISSNISSGAVLTNRVRMLASNEDLGEQPDNVRDHRFQVFGLAQANLSTFKHHVPVPIDADSSTSYGRLARQGFPFYYSIWVANAGGCAAENVVLQDVLPEGVSFVAASPTPTIRNGTVITWELGNLQAFTQEIITVTVQPDSGTQATEFVRNWVHVSSDTYDPDLEDNGFLFITGINASRSLYLPIILKSGSS